MARISDALLRSSIPTALVLGAEPELLDRCREVAVEIGVVVKGAPLSMAEALAEERRPLAIVVPEPLYTLDPSRYEAITRAITGTLVRVHPEVPARELEERMFRAVRTSVTQREWRAAPGRYAGIGDEPPPSRSGPSRDRAAPESAYREAPMPASARVEARVPRLVRRVVAPEPAQLAPVTTTDRPPPSSRRAPVFHIELGCLFDGRGMPRSDV